MADAVYKCFLAAISESVRLLKVGLCLNFCIATRTLPILISCSLTLEVDSVKEPGHFGPLTVSGPKCEKLEKSTGITNNVQRA